MNQPIAPDWHARTDAALAWLRRAWAATGGQGFSHSYSPIWGWAKAYPETTGYIIETLRDYADLKNDPSLLLLAEDGVRWLQSLQMPNGAFPGLLIGHKQASVFNTAMILFGISDEPARRALDFLSQNLEPDGAWRKHAYIKDFVPCYYTRAVWAVLKANQTLQVPDIQAKMRHALHYYAQRFLPNGGLRDCGFRPGEAAYTHTIAYALEGFWEAALLLKEPLILEKTLYTCETLWQRTKAKGRIAGRYDHAWRGDYSFSCNTGNAQLSILFHRLFAHTRNADYQCAAHFFLQATNTVMLGENSGGIAGSTPIWGPYLRFRYPNWAVKFYLDAMKHSLPSQTQTI